MGQVKVPGGAGVDVTDIIAEIKQNSQYPEVRLDVKVRQSDFDRGTTRENSPVYEVRIDCHTTVARTFIVAYVMVCRDMFIEHHRCLVSVVRNTGFYDCGNADFFNWNNDTQSMEITPLQSGSLPPFGKMGELIIDKYHINKINAGGSLI